MSGEQLPFFSIIVPAHNEERCLGDTLTKLEATTYPKDRYEVLVIENGSSDRTAEVAKLHESPTCKVFSYTQKGVSFARNRGVEQASSTADWVIFLDADSFFLPSYLGELADYMKSLHTECGVGGNVVRPFPDSSHARAWFRFYDGVHHVFGQAIHAIIVRSDLARATHFNEKQAWMEDVQYVRHLKTKSKFFFFKTQSFFTSTRRNEHDGWWSLLFWEVFVGVLPSKLQALFEYSAVR